MKKYLIILFILTNALGAQAQSRKYVANFSLFQQYFNPALTGYEGSMVKTFYRNQWSGVDEAPKTIFVSGELDLADLKSWKNNDVFKSQDQSVYNRQSGGNHAFGLAILNDRFGPFNEMQIQLNYGSRVKLSESLSLRWGGALSYTSYFLDGNRLTIDQENDPEFDGLAGQRNRTGKADINLGLMLTAENYYVGYAVNGVTDGKLVTTGDDYLNNAFKKQHIIQAGARMAVSDQVGLVANAMYQYNGNQKEMLEGQVKGVYQNTFWLGGGIRKNLAYSATAGFRLDQLKIGYVYEVPSGDGKAMNVSTNEVSLTYNLVRVKHPKFSKEVSIW